MIKTTRIKYSQAPRIIVDDLSAQCDGVTQTFVLSRPVPEWAPYCLVFNGQLYTNTSYKQWFVLGSDRKTIYTSFITPPTKGPNKSLILIVGVAGMEDLAVTWDDIADKPDIPTLEQVDAKDAVVLAEAKEYSDQHQAQSDWTEADTASAAFIKNKPTLSTVATSGSYNDLSNKPTIPTVNNATLTIQKNGTTVKTFTANASSDVTANISVPTKTSDLTNDSGFIDSVAWGDVTGKPTFATVATSGSYNDLGDKPTIPAAQVNSDWNASSGKAQILNKPTLAAVATSGSYNDLTNKPSIPSGQIQSDWTQTNNAEVDYIKNKPTLATVATSGSYNDLSNKPTIPTVNNATLTITQNGTSVGTFTANASSNKTIAVTDTTYSDATTSASGLMSASDKTKLDGIATGAEVNVQANWTQTTTTADDYIKNKPTLATVATSGSYNDLSNKPTIPAAQVNSDWNSASGVSQILNKPTLATVATSGAYSDLSGTPDVPVITMTNTDPGEGGTLAANNFIGVYS